MPRVCGCRASPHTGALAQYSAPVESAWFCGFYVAQGCAAVTTDFRVFHPREEFRTRSLPVLPPPSSHLLSLDVSVLEFSINGIVRYVAWRAGSFHRAVSKSVHAEAQATSSLLAASGSTCSVSVVHGHLGCFHVLAFVSIRAQVSVWMEVFCSLGDSSGSGAVGPVCVHARVSTGPGLRVAPAAWAPLCPGDGG